MTTQLTTDAVMRAEQFQIMEVKRGLRSVTRELTGVAQEFYALGDDSLAEEAQVLCAKVGDLLDVAST